MKKALKIKREGDNVRILGGGKFDNSSDANKFYDNLTQSLLNAGLSINRNLSAVNGNQLAVNVQGTVLDEDEYNHFVSQLDSETERNYDNSSNPQLIDAEILETSQPLMLGSPKMGNSQTENLDSGASSLDEILRETPNIDSTPLSIINATSNDTDADEDWNKFLDSFDDESEISLEPDKVILADNVPIYMDNLETPEITENNNVADLGYLNDNIDLSPFVENDEPKHEETSMPAEDNNISYLLLNFEDKPQDERTPIPSEKYDSRDLFDEIEFGNLTPTKPERNYAPNLTPEISEDDELELDRQMAAAMALDETEQQELVYEPLENLENTELEPERNYAPNITPENEISVISEDNELELDRQMAATMALEEEPSTSEKFNTQNEDFILSHYPKSEYSNQDLDAQAENISEQLGNSILTPKEISVISEDDDLEAQMAAAMALDETEQYTPNRNNQPEDVEQPRHQILTPDEIDRLFEDVHLVRDEKDIENSSKTKLSYRDLDAQPKQTDEITDISPNDEFNWNKNSKPKNTNLSFIDRVDNYTDRIAEKINSIADKAIKGAYSLKDKLNSPSKKTKTERDLETKVSDISEPPREKSGNNVYEFARKHSNKLIYAGLGVAGVGLAAFVGLELLDRAKEAKIETLQSSVSNFGNDYNALMGYIHATKDNLANVINNQNVAQTAVDSAKSILDNLNNVTSVIVDKGDCLWNLIKDSYQNAFNSVPTNQQICDLVQEVVKTNGIQNPDLIYPDQNIDLSSVVETAKTTTQNSLNQIQTNYTAVTDSVKTLTDNLKNATDVKNQIDVVQKSRIPGYYSMIALGTGIVGAIGAGIGAMYKFKK